MILFCATFFLDERFTAAHANFPPTLISLLGVVEISRATLHMRLRARDHYTSKTLIGGKGRAGSSLLHTTLEGPTEYVNARWMQSLHGFLHGIK